jgi:hypothetical protein
VKRARWKFLVTFGALVGECAVDLCCNETSTHFQFSTSINLYFYD